MKLLILTQSVDRQDPVLGFFLDWLRALAAHCDQLIVVALRVGDYELPANVQVYSLGKERGVSRLGYLVNFFRFIWRERHNYQTVFVHMNAEYVVLGAWLWRCWGRPIWLWRNHPAGGWIIRLAAHLSDRLFCTSPQSFVARYRRTELMPLGIDTDYFKPDSRVSRVPHRLLCLGRISAIKRLELVLQAAKELQKRGVNFALRIVGEPTSALDRAYLQKLHHLVDNLGVASQIEWRGSVLHHQTLDEYRQAVVVVNATPAGSFDKTIGEALAAGTLVISSNPALPDKALPALLFKAGDSRDLADRLAWALALPASTRGELESDLRRMVVANESLLVLIERLLCPLK